MHACTRLLLGAVELVVVDGGLQGSGLHALDGAADGVAGAEDLLHGALELLREGLVAHLSDDLEELGLGQVARVLDVLDLLSVTEGLLELLDDQAGGVRLNVDLGSSVLNGQLHGDTNALPSAGALDNVITDLLRRHAQRTDLRGQHGRRGLLASILPQEDDLHLVGVKLGGHGEEENTVGWKGKEAAVTLTSEASRICQEDA
mmetsp:Transcript_8710/g.12824  ORF Transcript_8710/g.12824 Transcript_8710/m.12824 type:complete len:203 (+) Transcript_8710:614-1222(+)